MMIDVINFQIYIVILLAIGIIGVYFIFGKQKGASVSQIASDMIQASSIAYDIVAAIEQMEKSGQISKSDRYALAVTRLREIFPHLTESQLKVLIEGSLFILDQGLIYVRNQQSKADKPIAVE